MITEPVPDRLGVPPPVRASFTLRVASHLIDVALPSLVLVGLLAGAVRARHPGLPLAVLGLGSPALLAFVVWNSGYRQGRTGQSLGKAALGTRLVGAGTGRPVGFRHSLLRQVAHLLDAVPLSVGYLWPLWDEHRQTFADKVCATCVVRAGAGAGRPPGGT